ncbi:MAG TPA: hypothetical protein VK550_07130 [Polyangiaceae bacterium]|nr:hypothetical protein [Polyangiaceae bacterium]
MNRLWGLGCVFLFASLALNAALLYRAASPRSQARETTVTAAWNDEDAAAPFIESSSSPSLVSETLPECLSRFVSLQSEAAQVAQKLRDVLPPFKIFRMGVPNADAEATFRPLLARVLSVDGGAPPNHVVECRDVVCRLTIVRDGKPQANDWLPLQRDSELLRLTTLRAFRGSHTTEDAITGAPLSEERIYFRLHEVDAGVPGKVH